MIFVFHNVACGGLTLLLWLQAQIRAEHVNSFTTAYEYKRKVEFHLITGGSGAGIPNDSTF